MKKVYLLFIFIFVMNVHAQNPDDIIYFPNNNLKAILLNPFIQSGVASSDTPYFNTSTNSWEVSNYQLIDTNGDNEIQVSEALAIKFLNIRFSTIVDYTGLEAFNNLECLILGINPGISNLNFFSIPSLKILYCIDFYNMTSINISNLSNLQYFYCISNDLLSSIDLSQNPSLIGVQCKNNSLNNLNLGELPNIEELGFDDNNLNSIDVSQYTTLKKLNLSSNNFSSIDISQNLLLEEFTCQYNNLTNLNLMQNLELKILHCYSNLLTDLNLTQNNLLEDLNCHDNQLTELDISQNILLNKLICSGNDISALNLTSIPNLQYLNCLGNSLNSLNLTQNGLLEYLNCYNNNITSLNLSQNPLLNTLSCEYNQLTELDLSNNPLLIKLSCDNNQLSTLDITNNPLINYLYCKSNQIASLFLKNGGVPLNTFYFNNNPLRYVCGDDDDLSYLQNRINSSGLNSLCQVNSYCSFSPGGINYILQGNSRFDENGINCIESNIIYPNLKIELSNGVTTGSIIANQSGSYSIPVASGSHTMTPVFENPSYFTMNPSSLTVSFPTDLSPYLQDFCIMANGIKNDIEVSIIPVEVARPGFNAQYKIVYKNKGNQIANGALTFNFDDSVMDFLSSIPSIDGSGTNTLNWNFTDLNPFETREIDLVFNINSPMETPAVNGGDILVYTATIVGATDETPNDNTFTLNQTVVNSYDPNDKTCLEGNTISPNMVGEFVHYVIRFENTGTFAAENVVIADVIDTTKFEINSLVPQSSSHDFFTRINGNKVEFIFENINLPFDDDNNDGYVAFKIKTKPNLVVGNTFTNKANIYFDYNFPIITNTTSTTVTALSNQDFDFETNFTLYPNPAKEVLNIKTKTEMDVKSISIYNTLGQIIMTIIQAENGEINVSNLQSGSYFIKVFTDKGSSTAKFIKQ